MENLSSIKGNLVDIFARRVSFGEVIFGKDSETGTYIISEVRELGPEKEGENYIMPGFVDSHVHTESSLVAPDEFARIAALNGTVAAVADPHEIANVLGVKGVEYIIEFTHHTPFHFCIGVPSCVPSTCFETSGAVLKADDVAKLLDYKEVTHLSEVMNVPAVTGGDSDMMQKLQAARDRHKPIDGHAPLHGGEDLKLYVGQGISTDHECDNLKEAREKIDLGMYILVREGTAARNLEALAPLFASDSDHLMICTDDCHPDHLLAGPVKCVVKKLTAEGYDRWNILRAACITPVLHYNIPCGLLRKGDRADFIVVKDLIDYETLAVCLSGEMFDTAHQLPVYGRKSAPGAAPNNFLAERIAAGDIRLKPSDTTAIKVIVASDGSLVTGCETLEPRLQDGFAVSDPDRDILKIVVLNRYDKSARPAVGFVKGFSMKDGALASSVAHDSHNIVCIGTSDDYIVKAVNEIIDMKGGMCSVGKDAVCSLPLQAGGIFSTDPFDTVLQGYTKVIEGSKSLGNCFRDPFMTMSFLALPVIPWLKITDKGLFDYGTFKLVQA